MDHALFWDPLVCALTSWDLYNTFNPNPKSLSPNPESLNPNPESLDSKSLNVNCKLTVDEHAPASNIYQTPDL